MDKSLLIQKQIKDNAEDLHNYVRDLKLWEEEMKRKDRQLSNEPTAEALPPVRRTSLSNKSSAKKEEENESKKKKLRSYDYSSWDKFDVEKACEEIDNEDDKNQNSKESSEEIVLQEEKYLKEKALYEKELGNKHVKTNKWDEAIECYTKAIEAYPRDPVFFANRALCYLKKEKYEMVESDCTASLKLDPTYVKAMLRRAAAREALSRIEDASYDLRNALKLEPNNNQALKDLARLKEVSGKKKSTTVNTKTMCKIDKESYSQNTTNIQDKPKTPLSSQCALGDKIIKDQSSLNEIAEYNTEPRWGPCSNTIQPISKPPHMRSKKSLKRIEIYDVEPNTSQHVCGRKIKKPTNPLPATQNPTPLATSSREADPVVPSVSTVKPRSILTTAHPVEDLPPPPSTSVQFHKAWNSVKGNPHLRYRFLQQIPGEALPDIFKESLESRMFSSIIETLASEFTSKDEPVLSYLRGMTRVKRFSALALFMNSSDKSNLTKLFNHCLNKGECISEEIEQLRRLYELR